MQISDKLRANFSPSVPKMDGVYFFSSFNLTTLRLWLGCKCVCARIKGVMMVNFGVPAFNSWIEKHNIQV